MAKLTIGNKTVTVDDAFLKMTPEQQAATVEEISASLGPQDAPAQAQPSQAYTEALAAGSNASRFGSGRDTSAPTMPATAGPDVMGSIAATMGGLVNGIPVLGPLSQNVTDALVGTGAQLTGGDYGETVRGLQDRRSQLAEQNPIASVAGNIAGAVGSVGAASLPAAGAKALGVSGTLLPRFAAAAPQTGSVGAATYGFQGGQLLNSAASTLGLTAADSIARGERPTDALAEAAAPSLMAGAIPLGGEIVKRAGGAVYDNLIKPVQTAFNRENEVTGRIGQAIEMGRNNPMAPAMSQADEAVAQQAGVPIVNADRGGAPLRTLARTAANISPEASASLNATVSNRFETQAPRAIGFVQRLMNGATDDLALQEGLRTAARQTNGAAYRRAYEAPPARAIWNGEISNLMQATPFRNAINAAEETATNSAAVSGGRAVRNPFEFREDGTATLRTNPDGSRALPNLEFWDIVQRNLRNSADVADRSGDRLLAGQIREMRTQLNNNLDRAVPEFNEARRGAAAFFGAEDAIDAGKQFAIRPKEIPEARQAFERMSKAERDAFSVGYSSELIDTIRASRDRVNVINQVFGSQARREMNELALGATKARELEAYVRVEGIAQALKDAVGSNSTTAQQLIASGVLGGAGGVGGYLASGGDVPTALTTASIIGFGRRGLQVMGKKVDDQVMRQIGDILTSNDPALLERAIQQAALSSQWRNGLEAIQRGLQMGARGAVIGSVANSQQQPVAATP